MSPKRKRRKHEDDAFGIKETAEERDLPGELGRQLQNAGKTKDTLIKLLKVGLNNLPHILEAKDLENRGLDFPAQAHRHLTMRRHLLISNICHNKGVSGLIFGHKRASSLWRISLEGGK